MHQLVRAAIVGVFILAMPLAALADDVSIKVQGRGSRREALDAMCYQPLDAAMLGKLGPWVNGAAPSEADLKGKPVLLVWWASWFKTSHAGLALAQQLADKNKDLVVIAMHQQRGWEQAADTLKTSKVALLAGHDSKGEVFKQLRLDGAGGPNFFVVDRAGNMRFADVERGSVDAAVKIVVDESASDAANAKRPSTSKEETAKEGEKPTADAYKNAKWPKANKGELNAKNVQGKALPVALGKETWITPKVDLTGKVVVLDFWATWCPPCRAASPILDELQDKHKDTAVILGMSGQGKGEDMASIKKYLGKNKAGYSHANDAKQGVYKALNITGIPHVVIISTDGVVRWQGNPHDTNFGPALAAVIEADPGIRIGGAGKTTGSAPKP